MNVDFLMALEATVLFALLSNQFLSGVAISERALQQAGDDLTEKEWAEEEWTDGEFVGSTKAKTDFFGAAKMGLFGGGSCHKSIQVKSANNLEMKSLGIKSDGPFVFAIRKQSLLNQRPIARHS